VLPFLLALGAAWGQEKFRTDGGDEKLPWFVLRDGEFPPEGSAHYFAGELIGVDHLERTLVLRADRTDAQNRGDWDLPVAVTMLPYGSIHYHGATASLADIPLGTHLHGWFYVRDPKDPSKPLAGAHNRTSPEARFNRCLRLEDDFSHHARLKQAWRIESAEETKLSAVLMEDGKPVGKPKVFDLLPSTRVWRGSGLAAVKDLAAGQIVLFNLTWATLYGPGRVREIWLDEESRKLAAEQQTKVHQQHIRERGLAGWVDSVDNQKRIVTITLFDGVDPSLFEALTKDSVVGLAVAHPSLLMYDPVNDRKSGPLPEVKRVEARPGSGGVQIRVQPNLLLEGYRPKQIVRVYPAAWPVIALPREEQLFGRE
jgi:hypothetical protein